MEFILNNMKQDIKIPRSVTLGFVMHPAYKPYEFTHRLKDYFIPWLSARNNANGRLVLALKQYFEQFTNRVFCYPSFEDDRIYPNGTLKGVIGHVNHSKVDIGGTITDMYDQTIAAVDFAYPYKIYSRTFATRKPVYKPKIFGIFQTLSLSIWIAIILVLIALLLLYYVISKKKYSFSKYFLDVFAILMRQNSVITPSSVAQKILIYSWVVGAMFLCLAYDSVFLSFLTIPPVTKIRHLTDLAIAVENEEYHCMANPTSGVPHEFVISKQKHLRVIGEDIWKNGLSFGNVLGNFIRESKKQNVALFMELGSFDRVAGKFLISEDRFLQSMAAMPVRRGFCCKKILERFVHRIMASGLFFKYNSQADFKISLKLRLQYSEEEISKRKLTLTDLAPAFIFLLSGYFISFLVLIAELLSNRKKKINHLKIDNRKVKIKVHREISV